ncbi:MAG: hypothetical protein MAG581_00196 [Deltaproteobacteria bacterium]|nr:hypothetical protein [Deltaproteobacteria bacterium]
MASLIVIKHYEFNFSVFLNSNNLNIDKLKYA